MNNEQERILHKDTSSTHHPRAPDPQHMPTGQEVVIIRSTPAAAADVDSTSNSSPNQNTDQNPSISPEFLREKKRFFAQLYSLESRLEAETEGSSTSELSTAAAVVEKNPIVEFLKKCNRDIPPPSSSPPPPPNKRPRPSDYHPQRDSDLPNRPERRQQQQLSRTRSLQEKEVAPAPPPPPPPTAPPQQPAMPPKRSNNTGVGVGITTSSPSSEPAGRSRKRAGGEEKEKLTAAQKRRKKAQPPVKLAPEGQQLFKGMTFYFVPNDTINGARRMRINKATEFGARCSNDWGNDCDEITHIIADRHFKYNDILKYLKVESIPDKVKIVNETYPGECLTFRRILDVTQPGYVVSGKPEPPPPAPAPVPPPPPQVAVEEEKKKDDEEENQQSLEIKVPKKKQVVETQRSSDDSEHEEVSVVYDTPKPLQKNTLKSLARARRAGTQTSPTPAPAPAPAPAVPVATTTTTEAPPANYVPPDDALSKIIEEAKKLGNLPLDPDEGEPENSKNSGATNEDSDSDGRSRSPSPDPRGRGNKSKRKTDRIAGGTVQAAFQCMYAHDGVVGSNPNQRTIEVLSEMQKYYEMTGDQWRSLSYRKAIATLRKQTKKIVFKEEARELPSIGERLAQKIEEIVFTNHLQRLEYTKQDPTDISLKLFLGIYGVGTSQAQRWIAAGYKTLDDLLKHAKLSKNQKIGVERYKDFNTRIPREEVARHGEVVKSVARDIDEKLELEIMGSYRRGAKDCGDIDIIITKNGAEVRELKGVLDELVERLTKSGFLQCSLAAGRKGDEGSKFHGASKIEEGGLWRRIDFLIVPWKERGAALLYFTGNDIFNRSLRLLASKKGYRLNQRGLYKDVMRGPNRVKVTEGKLVEGESEQKIFEILGVPYRPPEHRIC
ncbi:hypothetical protein DFH27DRAFT_241265 [Peziza echinospora]|nr:hypothetical protein DFH27DRAFT_241265 [Peziza echinospora]